MAANEKEGLRAQDRLLRGNRAHKIDSNGLDAFESPNFPALATVGARVATERANWLEPPKSRGALELPLTIWLVRVAA